MDGIVIVIGLFRVKLTVVSSLLVDRLLKFCLLFVLLFGIEISPEVDRVNNLVVII